MLFEIHSRFPNHQIILKGLIDEVVPKEGSIHQTLQYGIHETRIALVT